MQAGDDDMVVKIGEKLVKNLSKLMINWSKLVKKEFCKPTRRKRSDDDKVVKIADTDIIFHYDDEDGGGDNGLAIWLFRETSYRVFF